MNREVIISMEEARNFLVNYHNLNQARNLKGIEGVMECFRQMKSIQYDPLNVVGRNADLVLQARVSGYEPGMLYELLYQRYELIDGFDKEMCIYEADDFNKFRRIRAACGETAKERLACREQFDALNVLDDVREHVKRYGLTSSKDISIGESRASRWGHKKLSSAALDYLYCTGELSVKEKRGTHKYYDFTENVVPKEILAQEDSKSDRQFLEWYIKRRIQSVGLLWNKSGGAWQGHFISNIKLREEILAHLVHIGEVQMVLIEGIESPFYMISKDERFFDVNLEKKHVKFLAPLDNMLWDREMINRLFDFNYRWEVYTPIDKRKYGYYVLPVLYGNQLIARFEPEKPKKNEPFSIKNWWCEKNITITDELLEQIQHSIEDFARYLSVQCLDTYEDIILKQEEE
ncbi:DNA glycosylase AlkZ-like family protein [Kineothrix sedimenti]|uniref:Crosslink repair DNA glycosylase YcaQ family protein n=1 Tax=Kineothrix sedimenti TaxID=3123317 RepID=A0ABZ3EXT6_9FIRM